MKEGFNMNLYSIPKSKEFKERSEGHPELWQCSLDEFIEKVLPTLKAKQSKHKLKNKVVKMAAQFLRLKFDLKELAGTIEYEVNKAIDESLIYFVNVLGEDV